MLRIFFYFTVLFLMDCSCGKQEVFDVYFLSLIFIYSFEREGNIDLLSHLLFFG